MLTNSPQHVLVLNLRSATQNTQRWTYKATEGMDKPAWAILVKLNKKDEKKSVLHESCVFHIWLLSSRAQLRSSLPLNSIKNEAASSLKLANTTKSTVLFGKNAGWQTKWLPHKNHTWQLHFPVMVFLPLYYSKLCGHSS